VCLWSVDITHVYNINISHKNPKKIKRLPRPRVGGWVFGSDQCTASVLLCEHVALFSLHFSLISYKFTCSPRLLGWTSSQVGWVGRMPRFKVFGGIFSFFWSIYTIHTVFTQCSQQFRRSFRAVPSKVPSHTYHTHTRVKVYPGGGGGGG